VPIITRFPGGRSFVRRRLVRGLRGNSGPNAWLDAATERAYAEPLLDEIDRAIALAIRLGRADEPEPVSAVVARIRVPVTVLLGGVPHPAGPAPDEILTLQALGSLVRVEPIAGVGHFPHEEAPGDVARRLLEPYSNVLAAASAAAR
jgi:pimeloyl-ACP methyl ester carboxylesterase